MGQLSVIRHKGLKGVLRPQNIAGLFPWDTQNVRTCTMRKLRSPLIDEECARIAAKQHHFSPEEADNVQLDVKKLVDRWIIGKSTSAWAARCVAVPKKDGSLQLGQNYRALNSCVKTDSGGLGNIITLPSPPRSYLAFKREGFR